jgi:transcriptional regulator with XRE-family HTH domain
MSKPIARIGSKRTRHHLYITEWREHLDLDVEVIAGRVGTSRQTIYRWESDQKRLTPEKIAALAEAMNIKPEQFWRLPPPRDALPSIDDLIANQPDDFKETAYDVVRRMIRK